MSFALFVWIHASGYAHDNMTSAVIYGFESKATCEAAAKDLEKITDDTTKKIVHECVQVK